MANKNSSVPSAVSTPGIIFDFEGTLRRLGGDKSLLADLVQLYEEDSPGLLTRMATGIESHHNDEVRHAAHSLRGLAANFGASALTDPLYKLEEAATQGHLEEAPALLDTVQKESSRLRATLSPHHR